MSRALLLVALLLLLLPAGCANPVDSEQLRICRLVLPALHPQATEIREVGFGPAALGAGGVRIEYVAREPGAPSRNRWAACGFAGGVFARDRLELTALDSDQGAFGEARVLYLRRFWLADAAALAEARQAEPPPSVPHLSEGNAYAVQQGLNAIAVCAIYALLATAYSLIYGLVGRINLAFGEIGVLGAFGAVSGLGAAIAGGVTDPFGALTLALLIAGVTAGLWNWIIGVTVIGPLHRRHRLGQPILVATIAVAIVIQEFLRLTQGVREHWLPPVFNTPIPVARSGAFIVTTTFMQVTIAAAALSAAALVLLLLHRSRFGREWRSCADDPQAAALFGVAPQRVLAVTCILAGVLAGLAGWVVAVYYGNVSFAMGTGLGLKALVAAVVGGIGSIPGAFLGGVLVGVIEAGWSAYFDIAMRDVVVYSILIVVFVLRPGGLLGFSEPHPRPV